MTVWQARIHGDQPPCTGRGEWEPADRPQVVEAVRAERSPALGAAGVEAEHVEADADAEVGGQEHVGIPEPAHQHVARRPRADARARRASAAATSSRSTPTSRTSSPAATRRASSHDRPLALARHRQQRRVDRRPAPSADGNTWVTGPPSIVEASPTAATMRPATVRAPATEICWPMTALDGGLERVDAARARADPGVVATDSGERLVAGRGRRRRRPDRRRGRAAGARGGPRRRGRASRRAAGGRATWRRSGGRRSGAARARPRRGRAAGAARGAATCRPSARRPGWRGRRRTPAARSAANGSRTGSSSSTVPAGVGVVARRLRRSADGVAANTSRTVSLNWRRLPKPDAAATAGERHVRRLEQRAGGVGALGAGDRERPGAELVGHHAVEVALAVAEAAGEARHALAIDDTVGDEAHRRGRRRRRGRPTPASPARHRVGSACTPGSRAAGRRPTSGRTRRSGAWA